MSEQDNITSLVDYGTTWLPGSYSTLSEIVDVQFNAILWLSVFGTIGITLVTLYFCLKYKRTEKNQVAEKQIDHNLTVEVIWTVIPLIIVMGIFYWGFRDYLRLMVAPEDAMEIRVTGEKWRWYFEYPGTDKRPSDDLVVPVGQAVKLVMSSKDVLHSFFIPNFRVKRDVQPNRYSHLWFEATKLGTFQIFCTEYCGAQHSNMDAKLIVMSRSDFEDWKEAGEDTETPLPILGKRLYKSKACNACHSIDGSRVIGPTWKNAYGAMRELESGESVLIDDNYLRESIVYPANKIAKGYPNVMNSYAGLLSDREINALIEYIKTLKE